MNKDTFSVGVVNIVHDDKRIIETSDRSESKIDQNSENDLLITRQISEALTRNLIPQDEMRQLANEIKTWLAEIQKANTIQDQKLKATLDKLAKYNLTASHYLQLALPLIPGFLSYNIEIGSEYVKSLNNMWSSFKKGKSKKRIPNKQIDSGK